MAKSRLNKTTTETKINQQSKPEHKTIPKNYNLKTRLKNKKQTKPSTSKHRNHIPLLVISIIFYTIIAYIILKIKPTKISDTVFTNSYLFLQLPLFIANYSLISFISLCNKVGFSIATIISILLFLKLQNFIFQSFWLIPLIIFFTITSIFFFTRCKSVTV